MISRYLFSVVSALTSELFWTCTATTNSKFKIDTGSQLELHVKHYFSVNIKQNNTMGLLSRYLSTICLVQTNITMNIPLWYMRTKEPGQGWGGHFHTFYVLSSTLNSTRCHCSVEYGKGLRLQNKIYNNDNNNNDNSDNNTTTTITTISGSVDEPSSK